jgi:hypothetical protein
MVARLRATASGKKTFLIRTDTRNINIGNYKKSEGNEFWAENWAFILDQYGIEE